MFLYIWVVSLKMSESYLYNQFNFKVLYKLLISSYL